MINMVPNRLINIIAKKAKEEVARRRLIDFTKYIFPQYISNWHHDIYSSKLDDFAAGRIKKLMVFMPPQHGKSELCSRRLPAKMLGDNPDLRIALVSYNHTFATKFNRDVQRIIESEQYKKLYPKTMLNIRNIKTVVGTWLRNSDEFEIVGKRGGLVSVGTGGGLTGRAVDVLIIDDPYKDHKDAWSPTIRRNVQDWYDTVANTRLHNDSQQLITLTRWHPEDLAGTLLKREPDKWEVVIFPAIKVDNSNIYDPRKIGEALWEDRHSLERLLAVRKNNTHIFESLYQQNPKPREGLLFPENDLRTYSKNDISNTEFDELLFAIDVATGGGDYYSLALIGKKDEDLYLLDVIFTKAGINATKALTHGLIMKWKPKRGRIESNGGGDIYANMIKEKLKKSGMGKIASQIEEKPTTSNKEARIFVASGSIKEKILFLDIAEQDTMYKEFYKNITGYTMEGKNENDDAPDVLSMIIDMTKNRTEENSLIMQRNLIPKRNL